MIGALQLLWLVQQALAQLAPQWLASFIRWSALPMALLVTAGDRLAVLERTIIRHLCVAGQVRWKRCSPRGGSA